MIQQAPFGRTNHQSTRVIFGGAALGEVTQADADRTLDLLLEYGVNHIDTAASYGDAELRIGPWMERYRDQFFLATKTGQRDYSAARDEIHRSLERLRVDSVDLIQLHNLVEPDEWEQALGPGGALEAAVEARNAGLVRWIGVTGHGVTIPRMHLRSLEKFDFDSVLFPYSWVMMQNEAYARDVEQLLALCAERNVAVQTIKSIARGPWGDRPQTHAPWYEPLSDPSEIRAAVQWVLARPGVFLNAVSDINLLPHVLAAATEPDTERTQEEIGREIERMALEPLFT